MNENQIKALGHWRSLNAVLPELTEQEVKELLDFELLHKRRSDFIVRLHGRYNTLRMARERAEFAAVTTGETPSWLT